MGLFGGIGKIFGGGGGGSSATTSNKTTVTVNPVTNVDIETKEIAEAIAKGAVIQAQTDLQAKTLENKTKAQELQQDQIQDNKRNYQILTLIICGSAYLYFKKKGGI